MNQLLKEVRHNPLLWLLVFVPVVFVGQRLAPEAHTLLCVLSVLAIVLMLGLMKTQDPKALQKFFMEY